MTTRKTFRPNFAMSAIALGIAAALRCAPAQAQVVPMPVVGQPYQNPATGDMEIVEKIESTDPLLILTDRANVFWLNPPPVNSTFRDLEDPSVILTVTQLVVSPITGKVSQVIAVPPDANPGDGIPPTPVTVNTVQAPAGIPGITPGTAPGNENRPIPPGNNVIRTPVVARGYSGSSGSDGFVVPFCLWECWYVGVSAKPGEAGTAAADQTFDVTSNYHSVSDGTHAIFVSSYGGNGGKGGDGYADAAGGMGGPSGEGGNSRVTSSGTLETFGNDAFGMFVQSRAGKGGDGGKNFGWASGGGGGPAAQGGESHATNTGTIRTWGNGSFGIYSQSLGGGGGSGGDSYGIVGSGGNGNTGGNGGDATAINTGSVRTGDRNAVTAPGVAKPGVAAHGVFAQSVGGTGGNGGDAGALIQALGGSGGQGGRGGTAIAINGREIATADSFITTEGNYAMGLFAQSVGGGGGDGGDVGSIIGLGGDGATGGVGGTATATNYSRGIIHTFGEGSYGIFAQSVGGGGGSGGNSGGIISIGGKGYSGGTGGAATVDNHGVVATEGYLAHAVVAQSVGGGGGNGGSGSGLVAVGGNSNDDPTKTASLDRRPNDGGVVTITNHAGGVIATLGDSSFGILAQSIGGGGGTGGGANGVVGVGGKGGLGGDGGETHVTNDARVTTTGRASQGIVAQSIGGGGGSANATGGIVALGGGGGAGGEGRLVTVGNTGDILTNGTGADGIVAQSIGGGGGNGASSGGVSAIGGSGAGGGGGGRVEVTNDGNIITGRDLLGFGTSNGARARGIHAESIGGGGGNGGDGGGLAAIGGSASASSNSDRVTVANNGSITTYGAFSTGIEAASIGGGGGSGGASSGVFLTIGGNGAGGANAGEVHVDNAGSLTTFGNDSHGIFAQSVGGGGGNGGNATAISVFGGASIGGAGGGGGNAALVKIGTETSAPGVRTITTDGDRAKGILAQSIGGGGGNGGFAAVASVGYVGAANAAIGGAGGDGRDGGNVEIWNQWNIDTDGDDSDGIVAQSIGGGGGNGGFAVGFAGSVGDIVGAAFSASVGGEGGGGGAGQTVQMRAGGDIHTRGARSDGIVAQSIGGGGGNGGFAVAITAAAAGGAAGSASVSVGGAGGLGGDAGLVDVEYTGNIATDRDESFGAVLQAVGGRGGNGGFTVAGAVSGGGAGSASAAIGVGGDGGGAGDGGVVDATLTGDISTRGNRSTGLLAQSVGGSGGNGGFNISGVVTGSGGTSGGVAVGVGGAGGAGGHSKTVEATLIGNALTLGQDSDAFVAQSVGGGGGNGGMNVSGTIVGAAGAAGAVSVGVGGTGGNAGNAAGVTATVRGDIGTAGQGSSAFIAQSLGGGGGNGGLNVSASVTGSGGGGGSVAVGVGGAGGGGGTGSTVLATLEGNAFTMRDQSTAVLAQSVGGGGGNGGMAIGGTLTATGGGGGAVSVGVGGSGGGGGGAALTTLNVTGNVDTLGNDSDGIVAQSLGGGGGNGGLAVAAGLNASGGGGGAVGVGVGGYGGAGGAGGEVRTTIIGSTHTRGAQSTGITAQSIGGGGGNGGISVVGIFNAAGASGGAVAVGVGGGGGNASDGEKVTANVTGTIETEGDESMGFFAQSLGGGGGSGGLNVSGAFSATGSDGGAVAVGVGGAAGGGGNSNEVRATLSGQTITRGDNSAGVVAQSLGGGGGNGGLNVSGTVAAGGTNAGAVSVGIGGAGGGAGNGELAYLRLTGQVLTEGQNSGGVIAQSLGGGGGNGGMNVTEALTLAGGNAAAIGVGVGGSGGGGGTAGQVDAVVDGNVFTFGARSVGVTAQSIGGGGGNGGMNVTGTLTASGSSNASIAIGVGGGGGGAGNGARVDATVQNSFIATRGKESHGVLMQSVGGGGGSGGMNISGSISGSAANGGSIAVGVGGSGGGGGEGGSVDGEVLADVRTEGDDAYGVIIQSVGGGGGNGALNVTGAVALTNGGAGAIAVGLGGSGGNPGIARDVDATVNGYVNTWGARSIGVLAQSVGGGGGNGGMNITGALSLSKETGGAVALGAGGFGGGGGDADIVTLNRTGATSTAGANAHGVIAQSIGGGGGNGGMNVSAGMALSGKGNAVAFSGGLGGFGGDGGDAKAVNATVTGDVFATGFGGMTYEADEDGFLNRTISDGSNGVLAQSVGGGGGNGGINISSGIAYDNSNQGTSHSLTLGVGGFGGGGGNADAVDLTVTAGNVYSMGDDRFGVGAQSVGGGGGAGGMNISGGIAMDGVISAGIGGFGGDGGRAGAVNATATTNISATGANAIGFFAQSLGGDGGYGAINISGAIQANTQSTKPTLSFGIGGFGGTGNISSTVDATQRGSISVQGRNAIGVLAQSVAGGGGAGALNISGNMARGKGSYNASVGIGGTAGDGANADTVTLISDGSIFVDGREAPQSGDEPEAAEFVKFRERANGILVQSVGGGGGTGGMNYTGMEAPAGNTLAVGVGGTGGGGGDGGEVFVERGQIEAGFIATFGNQANGLVAQSIGGGGGNAGVNMMTSSTKDDGRAINVGVGGSGGAPGHGKQVDVLHTGDIYTEGSRSFGILAQSVGGGGGSADYNISDNDTEGSAINVAIGGDTGSGGDGGDVRVRHEGDIYTLGGASNAIFAQSVGGGGGSAGTDFVSSSDAKKGISFQLGRKGGTGGDGHDVSVESDGVLSTRGDRSAGIFAQSVGKGGGESSSTSAEVAHEGKKEGSDKAASLELGIEGGSGGVSGAVDVLAHGAIYTQGSESHGIFAQSVGGGGGSGGGIERQPEATASTQIMVGVGGSGGSGGIAGAVSVDSDADIATTGDKAHGIYAQSQGGGGGTGGYTATIDREADSEGDTSQTVAVSIGGDGGSASTSDTVDVTNRGTIFTYGRESHGINAESIGGGGGAGGAVLSVGASADDTARSLAVNIGGTGGEGGESRQVTVLNEGSIETVGDNSVGVRARSIGGKGGDGGLIMNMGLVYAGAGQQATRVSVSVGGDGAIGGISGDVEVTNRAQPGVEDTGVIVTHGNESHGVFAQSIGGGGGNGSAVITSTLGASVGGQVTVVDLAFGGKGGQGSEAGNVTVTNDSLIETEGEQAHGIFAQSIGGGGGNGGLVLAANAILASGDPATEGLLTLGGSGGTGDDAGDVVVNNSGRIITRGERSHGILAQSIGGGGGNAGVGFGASLNPGTMAVAGVMSAVFGGSGGEGGRGGLVTVNHSGDITVLGNGSRAIVAESINGGGGEVVLDLNGVATLPGVPEEIYDKIPLPQGIEATSSLVFFGGGSNQGDSNAGNVTLNVSGTFGVAGKNGAANSVQAVGGGGGTYDLTLALEDVEGTDDDVSIEGRLGGVSGTNNRGGDVASTHDGDLVTEGDNTPGALVQSIGGGGGRANLDVSSQYGSLGATDLTLGGENGNNEEGGDIDHTQTGASHTQGAAAHGGVFQSVGGGGGSVSLMVEGGTQSAAASTAPALGERRIYKTALQAPAASAPKINLGSNGGALLKGGSVSLQLDGGVDTQGDNALGLVFQSVGAGGGVANLLGVDRLDVTLGGAAGASGDGGDLAVTNTGDVVTEGQRAHGVFLQSIGGGGGAVFTDAATPTVTLAADNTGSGGNIAFTQNGSIGTLGDHAYSLFAQSVGGGGGFVDQAFAGSAGGAGGAGTISLELNGDVVAMGEGSTGLFAQSTGADGLGGNITATLAAEKQLVGGSNGVAVYFDGGAANRFTNYGSLLTLSGATGFAFRGGAGGDYVDNHGRLMGNIDLGGGANGFANNIGAQLYSGTLINLGDPTNVFTNNGLISPGAGQLAVNTHLFGSYVQSASGVADLEIDLERHLTDRVIATGTVSVAGRINLSLMNTHAIQSGTTWQPLFEGARGVTNAGVALNAPQSIVVNFDLYRYPTELGVAYDVDFAAHGRLSGNRVAVGEYLNRVTQNGGTTGVGDVIALAVVQTDADVYANMLTQLDTEFYAEQQAIALKGAQRFARNLQNCGTLSIGETVGDENGCVWARYDDNPGSREAEGGFPAAESNGTSISAGLQKPTDNGWTLGVAIDVENYNSRGFDDLWTANSKFMQLGGSARRDFGPGSFGATLQLGNNSQDVTRVLGVTNVYEAKGSRDVHFITNVFDYTWNLEAGSFSFQPSVNLGSSLLSYGSMAEHGAGGQSAVIDGGDESHLWIEPAIGARYTASFGSGATLRTFLRAGVLQHFSGTSTGVEAGLEGASADADFMRIGSDLDRTHVVGEAGLQYQAPGGFTLGLSYTHQESDIREGGSGSLRFAMPLK